MTPTEWMVEFKHVFDISDMEMAQNRKPSEIIALVLAKSEKAKTKYPSWYNGFDPIPKASS